MARGRTEPSTGSCGQIFPHLCSRERKRSWRSGSSLLKSGATKIAIWGFLSCFIISEVAAAPTLSFPSYTDALAVLQDFVNFSKVLVGGPSSEIVQTPLVETGKENVCLSKGCNDTALTVMQYIDPEADPCTDFYKFACGGFLKSAKIPEGSNRVAVATIIQNQINANLKVAFEAKPEPDEPRHVTLVKTLYKSCMENTAMEKKLLERISKLLSELGGWPVIEGDKWNETEFEWESAIFKMRKMGIASDYFINFNVAVDVKNNTRHVIMLDQVSLSHPREVMLRGLTDRTINHYYHWLVGFSGLLGADSSRASDEFRKSLDFEIELAKITLPVEELDDPNQLYNPTTVGQLIKKYPSIRWKEYFSNFLPGSMSLFDDDAVILRVPSYYDQLEALMSRSSKRDQANYMYGRLIIDLSAYMTSKVTHDHLVFLTEPEEETVETKKWRHCIGQVSGRLPNSVGAMYVRNYFSKETRNNVTRLVNDIREQLKRTLQQASWMEESTMIAAMDKAGEMSSFIGYPDDLLDVKKLDEHYRDLHFSEDDYIGNMFNVSSFYLDSMVKKLRDPVVKLDWENDQGIAIVNAYYSFITNSLYVPAGILQGLYFGDDRPSYMNYGAIGATIAHESTHGFDDEGRLYDKDGNLRDWWDPSTRKEYNKRTRCLIEQYGNYTVPDLGLKLNGTNTLGENIADNGGLKLAYNAYKSWVERNGEEPKLPGLENYSPEQMFWISYGNSWCSKSTREWQIIEIIEGHHSLDEFRVIGPISNIPEFAEDFMCPKNSDLPPGSSPSVMNPDKRCSFW